MYVKKSHNLPLKEIIIIITYYVIDQFIINNVIITTSVTKSILNISDRFPNELHTYIKIIVPK